MKFLFQTWDRLLAGPTVPVEPGAVHVYSGPLNPQSEEIEELTSVLSDEEKQRASRFYFEKNRNEFILCRGGLRIFLASYLNIPAPQILFAYTNHKKPYLLDPALKLKFNISHTSGLGAFTFVWNRAIGVDVEAEKQNFKVEEIAERFFSLKEREALHEYPPNQRAAAFYRCWTRKEAYIKARGEGLSHPLAQFDVSLDEKPEQTLLATRPDQAEAGRWILEPFAVPKGFAGAVAVSLSDSWVEK